MYKLLQILLLAVFTVFHAQESTDWDIRFYHEMKDGQAFVYADNSEFAPMSAEFKFTLENMTTSLKDGSTVIIPPQAKKVLVSTLTPVKPKSSIAFRYSMGINIGNTLQHEYDQNHVYQLPFAAGKTQKIFQGYHGKFSHQNVKALDFDLKEGEEVYAARGGVVVEMVEHHNRSCAQLNCAKYNNKIVIMHEDGTFADYSHLKLNGSAVKKGDSVKVGQLIGYSGSTGFATGPHLHFGVYLPRIDGSRDYIETKFQTAASPAELLTEGRSYQRKK